jgi:hypothetical protein
MNSLQSPSLNVVKEGKEGEREKGEECWQPLSCPLLRVIIRSKLNHFTMPVHNLAPFRFKAVVAIVFHVCILTSVTTI